MQKYKSRKHEKNKKNNNKQTKKKENRVRNDGARLYDGCMENYFDEYNSIIDAEKEKIDKKYDPANLFT